MPKCQICGEEEDKVYTCKKCGTIFCEWCGSTDDILCINCMEDDDEDLDDEDEPEFNSGEDLFYRRNG